MNQKIFLLIISIEFILKVYTNIADFKPLENAVCTMGIFDGVHLGHQKILAQVTRTAKELNAESVVVTLWPHPKSILHPEGKIKLLCTLEEKIDLMAQQKIDHLIVLPFSLDFSNISADYFSKHYIAESIGTKVFIIGYDHRFGKNKEGGFEYLKSHAAEYGFEVKEIDREDVDNAVVSSTRIREAIEDGDVNEASHLLGRPYIISGKVIKGKQLGRTIGFPTANIEILYKEKLLAKHGVYAGKVSFDDKVFGGMMNIGIRPTFNEGEPNVEVNIFDFEGDIYDKNVKLELISRLRNEQKFESIDGLIAQLHKDKESSIKILQEYGIEIIL